MADFTHPLWGYAIAIITIVSIIAMFLLLHGLTSRPTKPGEPVKTMGHKWDGNLEELNNPMPRWWLLLFYATLVWGVIYLALYPGLGAFNGLLNWSQIDQYNDEIMAADETYGPLFAQYLETPVEQLVDDEVALAMGERLFSTYCSTCHGSDARGARGFPNLRDSDWLYGGTPAEIHETIENGRSGLMPGWAEIIGDDGVKTVGKYVLHLAGRNVDARTVRAGKPIYDTTCAACHGADGSGNPQLGAPNLTDDVWLYGGSELKVRESIAIGRNGVMPPHGVFLGAAKIHLLTAYVYQFRHR